MTMLIIIIIIIVITFHLQHYLFHIYILAMTYKLIYIYVVKSEVVVIKYLHYQLIT